MHEYHLNKTNLKIVEFSKINLPFQHLVNYVMFDGNDFIPKMHFSAVTKRADKFDKNSQRHMTWEGLSSVCAKSELVSYRITKRKR